ncbi:MAG: insulinase family protein [Proteobacteria bacterium]|nr:insulinase family protein [Pseudomonadota bacterium]
MAMVCLMSAANAAPSDRWTLPIQVQKLDNGLTVVVSEDHSSPTVGIAAVYKVGIRTEPRGRTGFAHLFEHLMFEGTPDAPAGVFDRVTADGGGDNNGSTHPDFTSYIERAPVSALEPLLWLEADRMKTLDFEQSSLDNQRDVVKEEIRVNVLNRPYGGFADTDLAQLAFSKWENAHDGYGSFDDLDKASLTDVRAFHRDFYGPNDAVLAIAGDVTPAQGFALARKYFGAIPARATPPRPDVDEPLNTAEKRRVEGDALAKLPALAVGWKMPARGSRDQAAMVVLGELLAGGGDASRLYQALVKGSALAVQVGDSTGSGSPWEYDGPTLYAVVVIHKVDAKPDAVLAAIDAQIERIVKEGVDAPTLQAVKTHLLAGWYDDLDPFMDRAEHLAVLQALWGDAGIANQIPDRIDTVTSADVQRVAATYLTHANRSIIERVPDFMLPANSPARSDRRAKDKPKPAKPAKPAGTVVVGDLQHVAVPPAATTPTVPAATKPAQPAPANTPNQSLQTIDMVAPVATPVPAPSPAAAPETTPSKAKGSKPATSEPKPTTPALAPTATSKPLAVPSTSSPAGDASSLPSDAASSQH